jgi:glutamate-5-semialdehyde dehydrogenase
MSELTNIVQRAKTASYILAGVSSDLKNQSLSKIAEDLFSEKEKIFSANQLDLKKAQKKGLSVVLLDRLTLNEKRLQQIIEGIEEIIKLPDPVGEILAQWSRPNGLKIKKVRVPFGVVGIIYEARPNVTVDVVSICLKTGNAAVLRGGSDAFETNKVLVNIIRSSLKKSGLPEDAVVMVENTDRQSIMDLIKLRGLIDLVIPRGGENLIKAVVENSTVPVIETGTGNCHVYIEKTADINQAVEIVFNAKVQRPSVCNAAEKLLIDQKIATSFLPPIFKRLKEAGVELRGDEEVRRLDSAIRPATEEDWYTEYLDLIMAVKIVANIDEAITHINKYGSHHTEAIITRSEEAAKKFTRAIDSAAVFVNASTRFTDGGEFGFGAEIGISTQKLHARGPMGLVELTSYKYIIEGSGQIRT